MASYMAEFSDDGGKSFASNRLRFATEEEATRYAKNLFYRWTLATNWRVVPSDDPATDSLTHDGTVVTVTS